MYRAQCVLALVALYVGLAHSWDIAVSLGDKLEFYTNGFKTDTVRFKSHNLTALAYDDLHNMMLYVDKQSDNDAICGYSLHSMENKCFTKIVGGNIHSIAFDPATEALFFIDARSINSISLKPGSNNNVNNLITLDDLTPSDIAVDSCRGHVYWSYLEGGNYMERARFDGSEREVINRYLPVHSMAIDPQTRKMYYIDGSIDIACLLRYVVEFEFKFEFDRNYEIILYENNPIKLNELTVSNDYLYWMNGSESYKTVWQIPKNATDREGLKEISKFYNETPLAIAANYKIKDQIQGQDCEVLEPWRFKINIQQTYVSVCENYCLQGDCSFNDEGLPKCSCNAGYSGKRCEVDSCHGYCVNNGDCSINDKNEPVCLCKGEYVGDRCEVSDCLNYCIQGNCSFNENGLPTCSCNAGYSGTRCEVNSCYGYCLNNGACSLNEEEEPFCQCVGNYEGTRCEADKKNDTLTFTNAPTYYPVKRNLTLTDLLSNWRKPTAKISVTVEL